VEERKLMKRMATAHQKYYSDAAEEAAPAGDSYTFEYDEEKKQLIKASRQGHGTGPIGPSWTRLEKVDKGRNY
jgi:hypothetical protein